MADIRRRRRRKNPLKFILHFLVAAVILAGAFVFFGYRMPYENARTVMPEHSTMTLTENADGTIHLAWPKADRADFYLLEIFPAGAEGDSSQALYTAVMPSGETSCSLPALPSEGEVTIQILPAAWYDVPGEERLRLGEAPLTLTTLLHVPKAADPICTSNPENRQITVAFRKDAADVIRLYHVAEDGTKQLLNTTEGEAFTLTFGDGGILPIPEKEQEYHFSLEAFRTEPGLEFYGYGSESFTVTRQDLLGTELNLSYTAQGNNSYTLTWDETKGDRYIIEMYSDEFKQWQTVAQIGKDDELSYTTGHLPVFQDCRFRVMALDDSSDGPSKCVAASEDLHIATQESVIYATVWPLKDLTVYADTACSQAIGTAKAADAYCVLEEIGDLFRIRFGDTYGYLNSHYCMINLPEYLGELCAFNITNSYSSIYMAHEFEIPKVTATVIKGYEDVLTGNGYLAPLLYPTAKKLVKAGLAAQEAGYQLLIYDSFRPRQATVDIYNKAKDLQSTAVPENTFTGKSVTMPQLKEGQVLTYKLLMTGNKYPLNYFLSAGYSKHNLGIAVDLTMIDTATGKELQMQTYMHDLTYFSELSNNNENAKALDGFMRGAGFGGLVSEWWHFQDNEALNRLNLNCHLWSGVSSQCWMADDNGWKYRLRDGSFYTDTTVTIDGVSYSFDAHGYVVE